MKYLRFGGADENGMPVFGDVEDMCCGYVEDKGSACVLKRKTKAVPVFGNVEKKGRTCVYSC